MHATRVFTVCGDGFNAYERDAKLQSTGAVQASRSGKAHTNTTALSVTWARHPTAAVTSCDTWHDKEARRSYWRLSAIHVYIDVLYCFFVFSSGFAGRQRRAIGQWQSFIHLLSISSHKCHLPCSVYRQQHLQCSAPSTYQNKGKSTTVLYSVAVMVVSKVSETDRKFQYNIDLT